MNIVIQLFVLKFFYSIFLKSVRNSSNSIDSFLLRSAAKKIFSKSVLTLHFILLYNLTIKNNKLSIKISSP